MYAFYYMKPVAYLLCGLPGSGKTTYAKNLEKHEVLRLSLDEELFKRFGRFAENYQDNEKKTKVSLKELLIQKLQAGTSIVLDYGFWKKSERDEYKKLVEDNGGEWRLVYFKVSSPVLHERLVVRNVTDSETNHIITPDLLDMFISQFEEPHSEREEVY